MLVQAPAPGEPAWMSDPIARERAESLGLTTDPECVACAEWIYCGGAYSAHRADCPHRVDVVMTSGGEDPPDAA